MTHADSPADKTPADTTSADKTPAQIPASKLILFDTTLRDGEQCPGATMTFDDKLEVADLLDTMGVDVIEAGFPIASIGDFEAVSAIAKGSRNATIAGLARAIEGDIARCGEAVRHAGKPRIHTFVSTSPIHLAHQMNKSQEQVLEIIGKTVTQARNLVPDVEWSAMDATRTPIDYLCRCVEAALKAGATTINLPDTVGYAIPAEYEAMFRQVIAYVRDRLPHAEGAIFSTHCHDDLGFAVANSFAGVAGGARQIECTINGLGERAGNAALEEIVMAVRTRGDALPYVSGIDATMLTRASKLVSAVSSFPVQYNKAVVGRNAFSHESGIHQDGVLKNALTYEIMTPESVGLAKSSLVMGKHSGRAAFKDKLREMGYSLGDNAMQDAFTRFKDLADKKKIVYDEDIEALVDDEIGHKGERIRLASLDVRAGTHGPQTAEVALDIDGARKTFMATGNGPIDAIFNGIVTLVPHNAVLELYQVHAVTQGTDAQAEVTVRLSEGDKQVTARGADPDTLVASARAYIAALNKLVVKRGKLRPDTLAG